MSVPSIAVQKVAKFTKGPAFVSINHPDANPEFLSWMPNLLPIDSEGCEWGWDNDTKVESDMPSKPMVYSQTVLLAWVRRLVAMRRDRGEGGLSGLPENCRLMPSSTELKSEGNIMTLSMIVDLGDGGLVRPWASVKVDGEPSIVPAPEGISENWVMIHDALAGLLITGLETLPRQLLLAGGCEVSIQVPKLDGEWVVHNIE